MAWLTFRIGDRPRGRESRAIMQYGSSVHFQRTWLRFIKTLIQFPCDPFSDGGAHWVPHHAHGNNPYKSELIKGRGKLLAARCRPASTHSAVEQHPMRQRAKSSIEESAEQIPQRTDWNAQLAGELWKSGKERKGRLDLDCELSKHFPALSAGMKSLI